MQESKTAPESFLVLDNPYYIHECLYHCLGKKHWNVIVGRHDKMGTWKASGATLMEAVEQAKRGLP